MNWKSFKQEKPLIGQRVLVYNPLDQDYVVGIYTEIGFHLKYYEYPSNPGEIWSIFDKELWCPIPILPKEIK